ncbi:MGMT family protein [Desulfobacter curvatus]|uniref:MGMT family protein n=1 Tax=Desulfobacter curvatus TaxID=2290 RepID=UPI00039FE99B|nr:MGMT family protein [Desulfobacter curvatus]
MNIFTRQIIDVIKAIPKGRVTSYGRVAALAGNPRGGAAGFKDSSYHVPKA